MRWGKTSNSDSFYQPRLVLIDLETLQTLEQRHWQNGLAEVVKYGVIYDVHFFRFLQLTMRQRFYSEIRRLLAEVIADCCRLKADVVALDETEGGVRAKLNYGQYHRPWSGIGRPLSGLSAWRSGGSGHGAGGPLWGRAGLPALRWKVN